MVFPHVWDPACCHLTKPSRRVWHHRGHNVHLRVPPSRRACLRGRSERWVFVWSLSGPYLDSKHRLYSDLNGLLAADISGAEGDNRTASAADWLKSFVPVFLSCAAGSCPGPCDIHRRAALHTAGTGCRRSLRTVFWPSCTSISFEEERQGVQSLSLPATYAHHSAGPSRPGSQLASVGSQLHVPGLREDTDRVQHVT